jgi:tRNA C32,U32 (ribose-2'-O)-methylase TrmJ
MSLAETQQIYDLLLRIDDILSGIEVKTASLERTAPKTKEAVATKRELLRLFSQLNMVLSQMGFPKEINGTVRKLQEAIFFVNALTIAMKAFERGTLMGNILGVVSVVATMVSASSLEGY